MLRLKLLEELHLEFYFRLMGLLFCLSGIYGQDLDRVASFVEFLHPQLQTGSLVSNYAEHKEGILILYPIWNIVGLPLSRLNESDYLQQKCSKFSPQISAPLYRYSAFNVRGCD